MYRRGGDAMREIETEANLGSRVDRKVDRIAQDRCPCRYGGRITTAEGDGADRTRFDARRINRCRDRHRTNQERSRSVFVRETDTNPRASNRNPCALPYRLTIYLQQRFGWVRV